MIERILNYLPLNIAAVIVLWSGAAFDSSGYRRMLDATLLVTSTWFLVENLQKRKGPMK